MIYLRCRNCTTAENEQPLTFPIPAQIIALVCGECGEEEFDAIVRE